VVSYIGRPGKDLSGTTFRHGERVAEGERGVWERPLGPGKYSFNTYAGSIILVRRPTSSSTGHGQERIPPYDESLKSIDLVTHDATSRSAAEPWSCNRLPEGPSVIQRFGDVKKLNHPDARPDAQRLLPGRVHKKTMLQLLQERD